MDRIDSDSPKLNHIKIYATINGTSTLIKQISFSYTYYNRSGGKTYNHSIVGYEVNKYIKSLKLDQVNIYSNTNTSETYRFEYNNTPISIRNSSGQDFWGYSNTNTASFVHKRDVNLYFPGTSPPYFDITASLTATIGDGNREADENKSKAGVLTRIYYPTGGYTDFEYEANKYTSTITVPTYERKSAYISSQGAQGGSPPYWCSPTGKQTISFSPTTKPYNAKVKVTFSDALGGDGGYNSYVNFDGKRYVRSHTTTLPYPSTIINEDVTLLQNGNYTIEAWEKGVGTSGAAGCPFVTARVSWDELIGNSTEDVENLVGGIRIKSITNYNGINPDFISKKEFDYTTPSLLIPIILEDYQTINWPDCLNTFTSHPSYALNINGGPSVEYRKVTEYDYDLLGKDNGKIVYEYEPTPSDRIIGNELGSGSMFNIFVHPEYYPCTVQENTIMNEYAYISLLRTKSYGNFSNYYTKSWASGSLKKQEFYKRNIDNSYTIIKSIENKYKQTDETSLPINYIKATFGSGTVGLINPPQAGFMDRCSLRGFANNSFIYNTGFYSFGRKLLTATKETTYDTNGQNPITLEKTYTYDHPNYFLTQSTIKNSLGKELKSKTFYPNSRNDLANLNASDLNTYAKLEEQHRIATPIHTETYQENNLLTTQRTLYKPGTVTGSLFPKSIQEAKGVLSTVNLLTDRIQYHNYNTSGNPTEISKTDGIHVFYIWGYHEQYPIAKIEKATYLEFSEYINDLKTKSNADNDRTMGNVGKEGILRQGLNTLRNALPDAMVTTYTYDPLIGVTSITDPKGYTIYYEYDHLNRLIHIRDTAGNITDKYYYNYAGAPFEPVTLSFEGNTWIETNGSTTVKITSSGGSGRLSYHWRVTRPGNQVTEGTSLTIPVQASTTAGMIVIEVNVRDLVTGREYTFTKSISVYDSLSATTNHPSQVDLFATAGFSSAPSGGSGQYSYSWTVRNTFINHSFTSTQKSFSREMGCHYYGNVAVTFVVTDNVTQKTKTINTSFTVGELQPRTATIIKHPISQNSTSERFRVSASLSDGSGNYSYQWYVNGVSQGGSSPTLRVSCSGPRSIDVECVITDNCIRQTARAMRAFSVNPSWCSSDGGGGDGDPDIADPDTNQ